MIQLEAKGTLPIIRNRNGTPFDCSKEKLLLLGIHKPITRLV